MPQHNDKFEEWLSRYTKLKQTKEENLLGLVKLTNWVAIDTWRDSKSVEITVIQPIQSGITYSCETLKAIAQRARVVQSIDHPGLMSINDYHVKDMQALYVVQDLFECKRLNEYVAAVKIDNAFVLGLGEQLCNILIYLQTLIPPAPPPRLEQDVLAVDAAGHIICTDFQILYLLAGWLHELKTYNITSTTEYLGKPALIDSYTIQQIGAVMQKVLSYVANPNKELVSLAKQIQQEKTAKELNTIYKLRSALKAISDTQYVGHAIKQKGFNAQST